MMIVYCLTVVETVNVSVTLSLTRQDYSLAFAEGTFIVMTVVGETSLCTCIIPWERSTMTTVIFSDWSLCEILFT